MNIKQYTLFKKIILIFVQLILTFFKITIHARCFVQENQNLVSIVNLTNCNNSVGQARRYRAEKNANAYAAACNCVIDPHMRAERARAKSITREVYRKRVTKGLKLHTLPGPIMRSFAVFHYN